MLKNNIFLKILPLSVVLLLCIPVVLPYFHAGYFPTHDGEWAVVRLGDMFRLLRDLQFPPRFSGALNFGYGYPLFNFAYPFPYYLGILFYIPFHSFIVSIKIMFALSVFLSAVFMYLAANTLWKSRVAAVVSSILYIYLPYRMVDLYVRGSIGESLSFVFFPAIFYLTLRLFDSPFGRFTVVFLSISIAMLVMTHNIMTVLFMPVFLMFFLVRIIIEKRFDVLQTFILCLFLGAGLSFFFWFPALFEKDNVLLSKVSIADRSLYFVKPLQLIIPSWGYAPPTESGGFSYQLGIPQIIVVLFSIVLFITSFVKSRLLQTPAKFYISILVLLFLICFIMLFPFTDFIWKNVPLLKEINYPWTLLSQLGFISALSAGYLVLQGRFMKYVLVGLCALSIILVFPYAHPQKYVSHDDNYYLTNEATTTSSDELMPLWVKDKPHEHYKDKVEVLKGDAQISNLTFDSNSLRFNYKATADTTFAINTIYYPGWKAYGNSEALKIDHNNPKGIITVTASQYRNSVLLNFEETLPRFISDLVSIGSILVILFILLRPLLIFK
jgi:hypothetical protein